MSEGEKRVVVESIPMPDAAEALRRTLPFAEADFEALHDLAPVERIHSPAGAVLAEPGQPLRSYWVVLEGEMRAERPEQDGSRTVAGIAAAGEGFGEAPILTGKSYSPFFIIAALDSVLVRFTEDQFWAVLARCAAVRKVVLANMAQRLRTYQEEALHREKLVSLGTMAAGLMHELHNP
ncbi:MAG: Crp/Fnr family transcriptional regulator, partial [Acidobacteriota bacterium]|nr:Crp/Fnr family transcriptional regulator [Acidobacteriota bacterium]